MPYFVCGRWPVPRRLNSLEREKEDCLWMLLADKPLFARGNPCKHLTQVEDDEDDIAERAVNFGGVAAGTARMVARRSSLAEYSACHHTRQTASPLRTSEFSPREVSA
jgi:hypothetical protein